MLVVTKAEVAAGKATIFDMRANAALRALAERGPLTAGEIGEIWKTEPGRTTLYLTRMADLWMVEKVPGRWFYKITNIGYWMLGETPSERRKRCPR